MFVLGEFSLQEIIYVYFVWVFVQYFFNCFGFEYVLLVVVFNFKNNLYVEILFKMKKCFCIEIFMFDYILEIIKFYFGFVRVLYVFFVNVYFKVGFGFDCYFIVFMLVFEVFLDVKFKDKIIKDVNNEYEEMVMIVFCVFNNVVFKINYFIFIKVVFSFCFDLSFLFEFEYFNCFYGMFFVIFFEFCGFYFCFKDIVCGGICIVKFCSKEVYFINVCNLFDENYNFVSIQQCKNKDIFEGGFKGVILFDFKQ